MVLVVHFTRASDVIVPDYLTISPSVPISPYRDVYGNWCSRIVAPPGRMRLSADGVVRDSGLPDVDGLSSRPRGSFEDRRRILARLKRRWLNRVRRLQPANRLGSTR
jgi:hypothetical protein